MFDWLFGSKEVVSDQDDEKHRVLQSLCQNHAFVEVQVQGGGNMYRSLILAVDKDVILIDELFPADEQLRLRPGQVLEVFSSEGGYNTQFASELLSIEENDGIPLYRLAFPQAVERAQRRASFRVEMPATPRMKVILSGFGVSAVSGVVVDASSSGMRLHLGGRPPEGLAVGFIIPDVRFDLHGGDSIRCKLCVRNLRSERKPYIHSVVGGEYVGLDSKNQAKLDKYIVSVQREQQRSNQNLEE